MSGSSRASRAGSSSCIPAFFDLAHQRGLYKIDVHVIQYPSNDNGREAICEATVESKTGEVFCDIGDANPKNCSSEISNHILRMASTRAKARAMRDFTNIGMTCLEELTDLDEVIGQSNHDSKKSGSKMQNSKKSDNPPVKQSTKKEEPSDTDESEEKKSETKEEPKEADSDPPKKSTTPKMSEAQKRAVYNLSRRRGISVGGVGKNGSFGLRGGTGTPFFFGCILVYPSTPAVRLTIASIK